MNKSIRSYDELLAHQQSLKELLEAQKQVIRYDINELKAELSPLTSVVHVVSKFFTKSKDHSLLVNGASSLVDLALKKIVFPRVGWVSRLVLPFLAKNISSHIVADNKDNVLDKVVSLVNRKKKKPQY